MDWGLCLLVMVLAAVVGYAGGRVAVLADRRRRVEDGDAKAEARAAFRLEHADGQTWSLVNTGDGPASLVSVLPLDDGLEHWPPRPAPDHLQTATSELLPTLGPGASVGVWLSRHERDQQLIVSWTSPSNVRMGPVALDVPPPR